AQMKTFVPAFSVWATNSRVWSGVRWAESTRAAQETPSSLSVFTTGSRVGQSESEPIIRTTSGIRVPRSVVHETHGNASRGGLLRQTLHPTSSAAQSLHDSVL